MKCACGKRLEKSNSNGMCWECFTEKKNEEIDNGYCKTEKLHTGWICPNCGYAWAPWIDGCANCNGQATYEGTLTANETGNGK